jgi:hypothetical protein
MCMEARASPPSSDPRWLRQVLCGVLLLRTRRYLLGTVYRTSDRGGDHFPVAIVMQVVVVLMVQQLVVMGGRREHAAVLLQVEALLMMLLLRELVLLLVAQMMAVVDPTRRCSSHVLDGLLLHVVLHVDVG